MLVSIRKMSQIVSMTIALSTPFISAMAEGGGPGNGGDAVYTPGSYWFQSGKWELLDLAEAGISSSVHFDRSQELFAKTYTDPTVSNVYKAVSEAFVNPEFSDDFKLALSSAIEYSDLDKTNLLVTLGLYSWELTNSPLRNVGDEHSTLDLTKLKVAQLALRLDDRIQIYAPIFSEMDLLNQVALVYHEIAYALTIPVPDKDGKLFQPSWRARSWVASFFAHTNRYATLAEVRSQDQYVFEAVNDLEHIYAASKIGTTQVNVTGDLNLIVTVNKDITSDDYLNFGERNRSKSWVLNSSLTGKWIGEYQKDYYLFNLNYKKRNVTVSNSESDYQSACYMAELKGYSGLVIIPIRNKYNWKMIPFDGLNGSTIRPIIVRPKANRSYGTGGWITFENQEQCMTRLKSHIGSHALRESEYFNN